MKPILPLALCSVLLCVFAAGGAEVPAAAQQLHAVVGRALASLNEDRAAEQVAALARYTNTLAQTGEQYRKNGDLEGLLAVTEEQKLLAGGSGLPAQDGDGTNPILIRLRKPCRESLAFIEEKYARKTKSLQVRYRDELEALKKRLTQEGNLADATAVRDYAATLALPSQEAEPVSVDCPACSGSGRKTGACARCSGSGRCAMCGGSGTREQGMKGYRERVTCIACKKSGKCPVCAGTGTVPSGPCEKCSGRGKVSKPAE